MYIVRLIKIEQDFIFSFKLLIIVGSQTENFLMARNFWHIPFAWATQLCRGIIYNIQNILSTSADADGAVLEAVRVEGGKQVDLHPVHQLLDPGVTGVVLGQIPTHTHTVILT